MLYSYTLVTSSELEKCRNTLPHDVIVVNYNLHLMTSLSRATNSKGAMKLTKSNLSWRYKSFLSGFWQRM